MDMLDFSEEEIQEQLEILGYRNIPKHRLREFKRDLDELIRHGDWKSSPSPARINSTDSQPSPPAFTKEKVGRCYFEPSAEGVSLKAGQANRDTHVFPASHSRDSERRLQGRTDSYAQHSVGPKLQLPPGAPSRLQVEPEVEVEVEVDNRLGPPLTDSYTSSPDTRDRRFIRRKVLRKHKGQSLVCDESVYSEDSESSSCLEERLQELRLSPSGRRDFDSGDGESDGRSSETGGVSMSAFESYIRGMTRAQSDGDIRPKPKSFIRPVLNQHKAIKKSDPVAKYFQYKQLWEMFKLPGETDRRSLRWEIREQLAYQAPPPKPRRVFTPNTYTVPTEKKRSALRWEVRTDLANGLLPHRFTYRF